MQCIFEKFAAKTVKKSRHRDISEEFPTPKHKGAGISGKNQFHSLTDTQNRLSHFNKPQLLCNTSCIIVRTVSWIIWLNPVFVVSFTPLYL